MSEQPSHTERELVEFLRSIDTPAPKHLHRRIEALVDERPPRGRGRARGARSPGGPLSLGWRLGGATAVLAAAAITIAVGLTGGGSAGVDVRQASAPALRGATMGAPPASPRRRAQLAAAVDGVAFPYWEDRLGWRATGARADRIDGRAVTTVFYANRAGQRIGYEIFAGTPAPSVGSGLVTRRSGTSFRLLAEDGVQIVAWLRGGHLGVGGGRGVSSATLLHLASWHDRSEIL
jgi:hypothetical protein